MFRGTTPTLVFKLPFDPKILSDVYITFVQENQMKLEKVIQDCELGSENKEIRVKLTQEDTLILAEEQYVYIQIRAKTQDGTAVASDIIRSFVAKILKDGEI